MPRFQLPVVVVLVVAASFSLSVFYFTQPSKGKIKLPIHTEDDDEPHLPDPFDVTKPEDLIDGYPIDEQAFWVRVCCLV